MVCMILMDYSIAQDLKTTLLQMRESYQQGEQLHIRMEIKVFEQSYGEEPFYQGTANIKKEDDNYWYSFGNNEMFMNGKRVIMIDHASKEMVHTSRQFQTPADSWDIFTLSIDSILGFYEKPVYLGFSEGSHHYRVRQEKGPVDVIEMSVDDATNMLTSLKYSYRMGHKVAVRFLVFDPAPVFKASTFDEERYLRIAGTRVEPSGPFKEYTLYDQSIEQ